MKCSRCKNEVEIEANKRYWWHERNKGVVFLCKNCSREDARAAYIADRQVRDRIMAPLVEMAEQILKGLGNEEVEE